MKHLNRFGGKQQRPRIRIRILRGVSGYAAGAIISPPAGAAQILLAKKDQLGRQVAEVVAEPELATGPSAAALIAEFVEAAADLELAEAPAVAIPAPSHPQTTPHRGPGRPRNK